MPVSSGVPGCCTCAAPAQYIARIITYDCTGTVQAGNSVTLRDRPAGTTVLGTGTTDAQGKVDFNLGQSQQFYADVSTPEYAATQTGAAPFLAGSVSQLLFNHPQCNWLKNWPATLYLTDPWGTLALSKNATADQWGQWGTLGRMVTISINRTCNTYSLGNGDIRLSYNINCINSTNGSALQLTTQYPTCYDVNTGTGQLDFPVPAEDANGATIAPWQLGVSYTPINQYKNQTICGHDTRNPPDLTFTGINFSYLGGPANGQVTVTS